MYFKLKVKKMLLENIRILNRANLFKTIDNQNVKPNF